MISQLNKELMEELEKVPEGMRYIEAPNYPKIKKLLEEQTPYTSKIPEESMECQDLLPASFAKFTAEEAQIRILEAFRRGKNSSQRVVKSNPALGAPYGQEPSIRSCNRHSNCEQASKDWLNNHAMEKYVPINFHCHDDECEDCFGC